ncbi:hypothetical protein F2Q68_00001439 [Brassica cretica]|uniref:TOG domain-containing protein n=1 Tax=Brassica cretica TaxID=69181 RepID=A0A8S9JI12_BRACR|nr:hypothetical protein F2Q68_00001439 [Brassica cretica]
MKTNLQENREKDFVQIFKPGQVSHFTWDWPSELLGFSIFAAPDLIRSRCGSAFGFWTYPCCVFTGHLFRKTVADSNAPVQEKALDALIAFLKAADSDASRYGKEVCDAIAAKCLTGRPKTVQKAQEAFLLWVELEAVDAFLDTLEKAIKNKVAKAVVPAVDVMFQALSDFGSKIIPPKRILKMLPELFDHQDQNVRASAKGVTLELCRWIGKDPVKSILFEKMRDTMLITDVNLAVAVEAIQAIGNLARGLRTHFSASSRFMLPVLLEKLKEKKPTVAEALTQTLQAMYKAGCLNLVDIIEGKNVKTAVKNKVPLVRSLTLNWLTFCLETSNKALILKAHKEYVPLCMECLNDGTPDVRDAAFSALAAIAKSVGMRPLEKSLEKLDDVRRKKLSEMIASSGGELAGTSSVTVQSSVGSTTTGGTVAPKRVVKTSVSTSNSAGGLDSLPREDISSKITPNLLKGFESPDWKMRLESIEAVNKILEEANKRIQPTGTGELFGGLRGRLLDSNKNLVMQTLTTIGGVASAMGPTVEKASKGILSDVLKCLGDNKKHMRECTLAALDMWLGAVHLDKMIPYIIIALTDGKMGAEGRKDLFDWLTKQLAGLSDFVDAIHLLKPASTAMTDKSADVRKAAEGCISEILRVSGQETIEKNIKDIQGPALALVLEKVRPGYVQEPFESSKAMAGSLSKGVSKVSKSTSNGISKQGNRSRALPTKGSRPDQITSAHDIAIQSQSLLNTKDSNKDDRERLVVRRIKFEELRAEQIQDLENDMMKFFREDLQKRLLSPDFKKQVDGLDILQKALPSLSKEIIEVLDILLRWFVLQLCKSNTTCLLKVLEVLPELFNTLKDEEYCLTEAEAAIFLPCLAEKLGHNIEKVREKMRELMKQIIQAYSVAKTFPYILEGLRSKNNRTRIECTDLIGYLLETCGTEINGLLKHLNMVASLTAERDGELRKAALNTMATGYKILGRE